MSQYNNIVITPNIGVSSNPNIEFSGVGNTTTKLEYYSTNNGSLAIQSEDELLFSVSNVDEENPDLVYAINDDDGTILLSVANSGITIIRELQLPTIDYLATGAASTTKITTKHYGTDGGYLAFETGISTSHIFSVGAETGADNEVYIIGNNDALPVLTVYDNGETGLIRASFASTTIGAASTDKMEISAVSSDNGLLEIANYGGNQLFSVSNNQDEDAFAVYRYANYEDLSITSFENRKLFNVSSLGIVTTYGALRVGTSNTIADSSVYNELYGRLNVRAPFSTTTEYVSIVPKFSDKGALSFESPVGTALTDRGTQIFSISNNVDSSIFRVNDLNRQPIFEASASGNAGIGTTNPRVPFDVAVNAQFRNRVGFSQTANPNNTSVIDIQSYTPGITTYFDDSAVVITRNRINDGINGGQIYTIEDNDNTLFRVNVIGYGLTTLSTPTNPVYQALDIDSTGDITIFDTDTRKQIVGFSTTNPIAGDGDMFRVDTFSSPFIGSFPTVSKALRIDKFGLIEVNRNINQISGIATVGLGSTSSPTINSTMSFELTDNTTLTVRVKGTDGVVRTGIITLS